MRCGGCTGSHQNAKSVLVTNIFQKKLEQISGTVYTSQVTHDWCITGRNKHRRKSRISTLYIVLNSQTWTTNKKATVITPPSLPTLHPNTYLHTFDLVMWIIIKWLTSIAQQITASLMLRFNMLIWVTLHHQQ